MHFAISWVLNLFKKPEVEITFAKAEIKPAEAWPFPAVSEDFEPRPKKQVKKATTRKPAVKKTVAKKTTKVVKKAK